MRSKWHWLALLVAAFALAAVFACLAWTVHAGKDLNWDAWTRDLAYDYTTEPAPRTVDDPPLQWHYEPSHFRPELGDLMLQQIQGLPLDEPPGDVVGDHRVGGRHAAARGQQADQANAGREPGACRAPRMHQHGRNGKW